MSVQDETAAPTAAADHLQQIAIHAQAAALERSLIPPDRIAVSQTVHWECDALAPDGTVEHHWRTFAISTPTC